MRLDVHNAEKEIDKPADSEYCMQGQHLMQWLIPLVISEWLGLRPGPASHSCFLLSTTLGSRCKYKYLGYSQPHGKDGLSS